MTQVFLLRQEDILALEFDFPRQANGLPVAARCALPNFPHAACPLLSLNGKSTSQLTTAEALQVEILCSSKWPVELAFGQPIPALQQQPPPSRRSSTRSSSPVPRATRSSAAAASAAASARTKQDEDGEEDAAGGGGNTGGGEEEDGNEEEEEGILSWSFAALESDSCTAEELDGMERGGGIVPRVMGALIRFVILKGQAECHLSQVWPAPPQQVHPPPCDLTFLLADKKRTPTAFVIVPYQQQQPQQAQPPPAKQVRLIGDRWSSAWLCAVKTGGAVVVINVGGNPSDATFQQLTSEITSRQFTCLSLPGFLPPQAVSDADSGFVLLEITARLVRHRQFRTVDNAKSIFVSEQQRVQHEQLLTAVVAQQLREKVCNGLRKKNHLGNGGGGGGAPLRQQQHEEEDGEEEEEETNLPPLPVPFPSDTAVYKDLWEVFRVCDELSFARRYMREVPNGVNLNYKYSKCQHTLVTDRRRLVWEECREYLQTKFRF